MGGPGTGRRSRNGLAAVFLAACLAAAAAPVRAEAPPGGLEGTWTLVEQTYGKGGSSLVEGDEPIRLRVSRAEGVFQVWIFRGDDSAAAIAWPAMVVNGRELRATARSVNIDAGASAIHAHYEVVPVEGEDLVLEIDESYALSPDGNSLAGTVDVKFKGGVTNRGGYVLHRRFTRDK